MKTTTTTPAPESSALGLDLNGNPYVARGQYRTADGKATIEWSLAKHKTTGEHLFSARGNGPGYGGQSLDRMAKDYPNDATVQEMAAVWRVYHLNDMRAQPIPADVVAQITSWTAKDNTAGESGYDATARAFLERNGLALRITKADSKPAPGRDAAEGERHHYRVTLSRKGSPSRVAFDFWGSIADAEKGKDPSAYDVLACLSSDINTPETFADFCAEYGENEDSIKARQTWKRAHSFAQRLRAFFTDAEREELAEIN